MNGCATPIVATSIELGADEGIDLHNRAIIPWDGGTRVPRP
jgi:hypothetical protein